MARLIRIYDTTLRDGTQGEGVSFSMEDKVRLAQRLDALGVHYIEGGWPGSNPKDMRFFRRILDVPLKHARVAAFGATRRAGIAAEADPSLQALVEARTPVATIFGKSWPFHVTHALQTTLPENLLMIADSVAFLTRHVEEVVYDAEHFFDGFKRDPAYALETLRAAERAGARVLVLCDTNGGTLPSEVAEIVREARRHVRAPLGIHAHNDGECAVANSLAAVLEGAEHVQGTLNGFGERCGNANLVSIIPNLSLKLGLQSIPEVSLRELRDVARFASELANRPALAAPAVRRRLRLRAQGRHARLGDPQAPRDLRAHPARAGRQPPARPRVRAGREVEHPVEGARVRDRSREGHARRRAASSRPSSSSRTRGTSSRARRPRSSS